MFNQSKLNKIFLLFILLFNAANCGFWSNYKLSNKWMSPFILNFNNKLNSAYSKVQNLIVQKSSDQIHWLAHGNQGLADNPNQAGYMIKENKSATSNVKTRSRHSINQQPAKHIHANIQVWISVSSLVDHQIFVKTHQQRLLQLHWTCESNQPNDWIGLFRRLPHDSVSYLPATQNKGKITTDRQFPVWQFSESNMTSGCLSEHLVYARGDQLLASNCLHARPHWMQHLGPNLHKLSLRDIMLPGTHNSGSYTVGYLDGNLISRRIRDYSVCQDESVFNQLIYGIRFLDLRVMHTRPLPPSFTGVLNSSSSELASSSFSNSSQINQLLNSSRTKTSSLFKKDFYEQFWIAHDFLRMPHSLRSVLLQVQQFIDVAPNELIFLDFHRFPYGFKSDNPDEVRAKHKQMFALVKEILGNYIMPSSKAQYQIKVGDAFKLGKHIIIGHAMAEYLDDQDRKLVFDSARHLWSSNDDNLNKLLNYLQNNICTTSRVGLEVAVSCLTPSAKGVIFNKYKGLRQLAEDVNSVIADKYENEWKKCANALISDFFLGNNLIDISIRANQQRCLNIF